MHAFYIGKVKKKFPKKSIVTPILQFCIKLYRRREENCGEYTKLHPLNTTNFFLNLPLECIKSFHSYYITLKIRFFIFAFKPSQTIQQVAKKLFDLFLNKAEHFLKYHNLILSCFLLSIDINM